MQREMERFNIDHNQSYVYETVKVCSYSKLSLLLYLPTYNIQISKPNGSDYTVHNLKSYGNFFLRFIDTYKLKYKQ